MRQPVYERKLIGAQPLERPDEIRVRRHERGRSRGRVRRCRRILRRGQERGAHVDRVDVQRFDRVVAVLARSTRRRPSSSTARPSARRTLPWTDAGKRCVILMGIDRRRARWSSAGGAKGLQLTVANRRRLGEGWSAQKAIGAGGVGTGPVEKQPDRRPAAPSLVVRSGHRRRRSEVRPPRPAICSRFRRCPRPHGTMPFSCTPVPGTSVPIASAEFGPRKARSPDSRA